MNEVNSSSGLFGFLKGLLAFGGMAVVSFAASQYINFSDAEMLPVYKFLMAKCVIVVGVGLIMFIRHSLTNKSLWGALVIFANIISTVGYWLTRSMMTPDVQRYIVDLFQFESIDVFNTFNSLFSFGYSTFQFIIGYFVAKFGTRFIGIFGICNAIALVIFSFFDVETATPFIYLIRFMSGVFCSSAMISLSYHINKFKCIPSKFGVVVNIAIVVAAVSSGIIMNHFPVIDDVSFGTLNKILIGLFAVPGIIFVADSFISPHESGTFNVGDYAEYFSDLLSNKKYMVLFVQAILVMIGFTVLRENFLTNIAPGNASMLKWAIELGVTYGLMFIISFINIIGYYRAIFMNAAMNIFGVSILFTHVFMYDMPFFLLCIAVFSIGWSNLGHTIIQAIVGETESKNPAKAASMIAILNTATMLIGGAIIGQNFVPSLGYANGIGVMFVIGLLSLLIAFYSLLSFQDGK